MNQKIAQLGKPSLVWGDGQTKRLILVRKYFDFAGKKVLDMGCGLGLYSQKFAEAGALVWGVDVDEARILAAKKATPEVAFLAAASSNLPFDDDFFELVFLNEVLEHVEDDKKTIREVWRVLKPDGKMIIFAPNRWFPFETHGIYLGKKYIYKNIPLINWLPSAIRNVFCPHVRIYTAQTLTSLFRTELNSALVEKIDWVWPAFDKIQRRFGWPGKFLKRVAVWAEKNFILKRFGISVFVVVRKKI